MKKIKVAALTPSTAGRSLLLWCLWVVAACGGSDALAHGGVSMEDDVCIILVGRYKAHFTGYLPRERATQEFCEDIPVATESVFVIDFIDDELREMEFDFRIIKDVNNIGITATYEDLGGTEAIEKASIFYVDPIRYSRGVVNVRYNFTEDGRYVGIVNAHHKSSGLSYRSVFPFSVGSVGYGKYVGYYVALFIFCAIFIWGAGRNTFFKPNVKHK